MNNEPPLIRIRREGKKDIITHKFNIGKPYKEPSNTTFKVSKDKACCLIHVEGKDHPELGDPDECGSYWIKLPKDGSSLDQSDEISLMKRKLLQEMGTMSCPEEGVTRELCEICKGPYAYGLNPRYISGTDDGDPNSPHLPELEFSQPVIQFDMRQPM